MFRTVSKDQRKISFDFLGRELPKGSYVSYLGDGVNGRKCCKLGLVFGYTKAGSRILTETLSEGTCLDSKCCKIEKDSIPIKNLHPFLEYEDFLTLPQKMKII